MLSAIFAYKKLLIPGVDKGDAATFKVVGVARRDWEDRDRLHA